eukprot:6790622-Prymnesium_polylepis.1
MVPRRAAGSSVSEQTRALLRTPPSQTIPLMPRRQDSEDRSGQLLPPPPRTECPPGTPPLSPPITTTTSSPGRARRNAAVTFATASSAAAAMPQKTFRFSFGMLAQAVRAWYSSGDSIGL